MDADSPGESVPCRGDLGPVHRLEFEVQWPPKHVAAYLLDSEEPILIDAGPPGESANEELTDQLSSLGFDPDDVDHVLLTHPHSDHIGQVPAFREAGATIHAPREVLGQLERDEDTLAESARSVAVGVGYEGETVDLVVEKTVESLRRNRRLVDPERSRPVDRSEPFTLAGRTWTPHHTPGHQLHHTCFGTTVRGVRVLFAGDALIEPFRPGVLHVGVDHGAYDGVDACYQGLDRLEKLEFDRTLPGHGPPFSDHRGVVESTRADLDELVEETRIAVEAIEPATPYEVTEERIDRVRYLVQVLDTLGALGTLERAGVITHDRDDGVRIYRPS